MLPYDINRDALRRPMPKIDVVQQQRSSRVPAAREPAVQEVDFDNAWHLKKLLSHSNSAPISLKEFHNKVDVQLEKVVKKFKADRKDAKKRRRAQPQKKVQTKRGQCERHLNLEASLFSDVFPRTVALPPIMLTAQSRT